jgi:hypothetical protein
MNPYQAPGGQHPQHPQQPQRSLQHAPLQYHHSNPPPPAHVHHLHQHHAHPAMQHQGFYQDPNTTQMPRPPPIQGMRDHALEPARAENGSGPLATPGTQTPGSTADHDRPPPQHPSPRDISKSDGTWTYKSARPRPFAYCADSWLMIITDSYANSSHNARGCAALATRIADLSRLLRASDL